MKLIEHQFAGDEWRLDLLPVQICVEKSDKGFLISQQTLDEIAVAVRGGIDLVVADYGYVLDEALKEANAAAHSQGRDKPYEDDVRDRILTTADLSRALHAYVGDGRVDSSRRRSMGTFLASETRMILYSYTSEELFHIYGSVEERANRTAAVFQQFDVSFIDTKFEFYNRSEFDWPSPRTKHDLVYYHFLLSGWLALVMRQRFQEFLLARAESAKSIRVTRSVRSVGMLVAVGSAVAAIVQWLTSQVIAFSEKGDVASTVVYSLLAVLVVGAAGLALPYTFEKMMSVLLRPPPRETHE